MEETAMLTARLDANLKRAFEAVCKEIDITPSQMIRAFVRETVAKHTAKTAQPTLPTIAPAPQPKKGQRMIEASKRSLRR